MTTPTVAPPPPKVRKNPPASYTLPDRFDLPPRFDSEGRVIPKEPRAPPAVGEDWSPSRLDRRNRPSVSRLTFRMFREHVRTVRENDHHRELMAGNPMYVPYNYEADDIAPEWSEDSDETDEE